MIKNNLLIGLLLWATLSYSQIPSDCTIPPALQAAYEDDVKDLALKRMYQIQSPDTSSIEFVQSHQDTIWDGLAALFNASTLMGRDSVFNWHCIHTHYGFLMVTNQIRITVDTSFSWPLPWQSLNTTTGNAPLDTLLSDYGFQVTFYSTFSNTAYLNTTQSINTYALCDSLETFAGITEAKSVTGGIGGGNYITYNKVDTVRMYNFTIGYGDCPSGCTAFYTWKYHVYPDCSVESVGRDDNNWGGEPFPSPIFCNLSSCGVTANFTTSSTNICVGDSIAFSNTSVGTSLFEWKENGVPFSTSSDVTMTYSVAGAYTISLSADTGSCMDVASMIITVNDMPQVDLGPDTAICSGSSLTLNAGAGLTSYLWSLGTSSQTVTVGAADTYYVQVTDGNGCTASDTVLVTVDVLPQVDLGPDTALCSGCSLTLDAGSGLTSYLWSIGTSSQTLIVSSAGTYNVQVTDGNGCTASDTIIVTEFVGNKDAIDLSHIQLYPNPTLGLVTITGVFPQWDGTINIYNTLGEIVMMVESGNSINFFDLSDGIYSVQLKYMDEKIVRKIVKYSE